MLTLKNRSWQPFTIDSIFITEEKGNVPTGSYVKKEYLTDGNIPRITVTSQNNGIDNFWGECTSSSFRTYSNFISVSFLGDVFYHANESSIDMKVHCLKLKDRELNYHLALFLCRALRNNTENSSYGNQLSSYDLARKSILLPVNKYNEPDYDFMESYARQVESQKRNEYRDYCEHKLRQLGNEQKVVPLTDKEWHEFFISEFFEPPKRGKRIISDNYIVGNMPVVSSAGGNNGVIAFAGNDTNVRIYENCLSVANGGVSAGFAFYHPYKIIATDHVTHFKGKALNQFHYLFLSVIIKNQMHTKYDFSREMTDPRLQREKLLVPVTKDGAPDFEYMEQYAKNIMIKKYSDYLSYIK